MLFFYGKIGYIGSLVLYGTLKNHMLRSMVGMPWLPPMARHQHAARDWQSVEQPKATDHPWVLAVVACLVTTVQQQ